jgi:hypothetical protein
VNFLLEGTQRNVPNPLSLLLDIRMRWGDGMVWKLTAHKSVCGGCAAAIICYHHDGSRKYPAATSWGLVCCNNYIVSGRIGAVYVSIGKLGIFCCGDAPNLDG